MSCGCTVWPRCGHDLGFAPTIAPPAMRPTTPVPGPDRVAAYLRAESDVRAAQHRKALLWRQMTVEERAEIRRREQEDAR